MGGGIAGTAHGMRVVEGCGGMWLRKMGQKWENNGTRYQLFTAPFPPLFRRSKTFPAVPSVKLS